MWLGSFRSGKQHFIPEKRQAHAQTNALSVGIPGTDGGLRMKFKLRKIATIFVVVVCLQALLIIFVQDSIAASKKVKQQIAATPPVTKSEKNNAAQLQAIEAQLRYWQGQEKAKPKPAEATRLGLAIGQNVKALWLQKYSLEEAMKPKLDPVIVPTPAQPLRKEAIETKGD
jgi:hypothetical protein